MIYTVCIQYKWRAARQDKKPKMKPANNYDPQWPHPQQSAEC